MAIYRQYSDDQLESHLTPAALDTLAALEEWKGAAAYKIHVHEPGTFLDWHPASGSLLIVVLSGQLEITVTDGTKLICKPGDLRFTSDKGKGHTGRCIGDEPCVVLMVELTE
ncbi:MAG: cupin domain-containing protein [Oscillospiraceae bacterium]